MTDETKEFTIDACRWHVDGEPPEYKQRAFDHFRDRYTVLLEFLRENDLLADPEFGLSVKDWYQFEIHTTDLTPEGLALFRLSFDSWGAAFGQGHTKRHLVQWKRRLKEMRELA